MTSLSIARVALQMQILKCHQMDETATSDARGSYANVRMDAFRAWIQKILDDKGWDLTTLARKADLSPSTLTRPMNAADYRGVISHTTVRRIAVATGADVPNELAWWASADEGRRKYPYRTTAKAPSLNISVQRAKNEVKPELINSPSAPSAIPIYRLQDRGDGKNVLEESARAWVLTPTELIDQPGAFATEAVGQKMHPAVREGAILGIHPTQVPKPSDYVLVIKTDGEALIKEFVGYLENTVVLKEYEPSPRTFELPRSEIGEVLRISSMFF